MVTNIILFLSVYGLIGFVFSIFAIAYLDKYTSSISTTDKVLFWPLIVFLLLFLLFTITVEKIIMYLTGEK